jgi:hypothetical protein
MLMVRRLLLAVAAVALFSFTASAQIPPCQFWVPGYWDTWSASVPVWVNGYCATWTGPGVWRPGWYWAYPGGGWRFHRGWGWSDAWVHAGHWGGRQEVMPVPGRRQTLAPRPREDRPMMTPYEGHPPHEEHPIERR